MGHTLREMATQHLDVRRFEKKISELVTENFFQEGINIFMNRTPGRLDLMGGNDDYTGGLVFETTIREATLVAVQPRTDQEVVFYNPGVRSFGWREKVEFSLADLTDSGEVRPLEEVRDWINADPQRAWCAYVVGDLYFLIKQFPAKVNHGLRSISNRMCRSGRASVPLQRSRLRR